MNLISSVPRDSKIGKILHNTTSSLLVADGESFHFLVTSSKGTNYMKNCNEIVLPNDPISTIKKYTEHTSEYYAQINLCLASDSEQIAPHGDYIQQLRASILQFPLLEDCCFYRGCDLSKLEMDKMEELKHFFIPSFTSTSSDQSKAYAKNSLFVIKTPYLTKYACSVTEKMSNYHSTEKETLFACYCGFRLERIEKVNSQNIVTLFLDETSSSGDKT